MPREVRKSQMQRNYSLFYICGSGEGKVILIHDILRNFLYIEIICITLF